jgi:ubiquinone biosynthesis monooxygenase Coq7
MFSMRVESRIPLTERHYSQLDKLLVQFDLAVKGMGGGASIRRDISPAAELPQSELTPEQTSESARLMRINHCGEVCAQALYQGQALTASNRKIAEAMAKAAAEEADHLAWCEQRIDQLGGHISYLNPVWYFSSLATGLAAGALGDRFSLGFLAATEEQVCEHLDDHLQRLPSEDQSSRAILRQMREDEARHATHARQSGGATFPVLMKRAMRNISKLMTWTTYRI